MSTHSYLPGRHHGHRGPGPPALTRHLPRHAHRPRFEWAVPVTGGVLMGLYAMFLDHAHGGSWTKDVLLGLVTALIAIGVGHVLLRERGRMPTEVRAASFGAFFGICMGFLYSLAGATWLRASGVGLLLGGAFALVSYYVFYEHEH
ncbi:hypothetical protein ACFP1Z_17845 [Streptomyces gamaensis]|uniref:Integral membrane protein n=1 Tax=Streptomyces gamaensis TaxID=1763542 RepID=A0ABW0YZK1_9ACTN